MDRTKMSGVSRALQKRKKCPWERTSDLEELPRASLPEMWRKLISLCMIINDITDEFWSVVWVRAGNPNVWIEHATCHYQICPLSANYWLERTSHQSLSRSPSAYLWWLIFHVEYQLQWWELGLRIRPWDEATVDTVEELFISTSEESTTEPQRNQELFSIFAELCIENSFPRARPSIESSTATFCGVW